MLLHVIGEKRPVKCEKMTLNTGWAKKTGLFLEVCKFVCVDIE